MLVLELIDVSLTRATSSLKSRYQFGESPETEQVVLVYLKSDLSPSFIRPLATDIVPLSFDVCKGDHKLAFFKLFQRRKNKLIKCRAPNQIQINNASYNQLGEEAIFDISEVQVNKKRHPNPPFYTLNTKKRKQESNCYKQNQILSNTTEKGIPLLQKYAVIVIKILVKWSDGTENIVSTSQIHFLKRFDSLKKGAQIKMYWKPEKEWYFGVVIAIEDGCSSSDSKSNIPLETLWKNLYVVY
nr:unnamed protein product [Callosobruchus chinensis]